MAASSRTGWITAVVILGLFALQQAPFVLRGDYSRRLVWQSKSPDERFRLEVRVQASFPAFDILDPSGTAYFAVVNTKNGEVAAQTAAPLWEIFDFQRPKVEWTSGYVEVADYDESQPEAVVRMTLNR